MSGIGYEHNKFETCEECPDRSIEPNCHNTCRGYLYRREKIAERKKEKAKEIDFIGFKLDRVTESKRKAGIK